jgi:hypothetical protein
VQAKQRDPPLAFKWLICLGYMGEKGSAPGVTRTPDLLIRSHPRHSSGRS